MCFQQPHTRNRCTRVHSWSCRVASCCGRIPSLGIQIYAWREWSDSWSQLWKSKSRADRSKIRDCQKSLSWCQKRCRRTCREAKRKQLVGSMPRCWHEYSRSRLEPVLGQAEHGCMRQRMGAGQGSREASSQVASSRFVKLVCGRHREVSLARV